MADERLSLEDAIEEIENNSELWDEMGKFIQEMLANPIAKELEGYRAYKIIVGDRAYYPRKGTIERLPTGWIVFVDELLSPQTGKPHYVTIQHAKVDSVMWVPVDEEENPAAEVFPRAA